MNPLTNQQPNEPENNQPRPIMWGPIIAGSGIGFFILYSIFSTVSGVRTGSQVELNATASSPSRDNAGYYFVIQPKEKPRTTPNNLWRIHVADGMSPEFGELKLAADDRDDLVVKCHVTHLDSDVSECEAEKIVIKTSEQHLADTERTKKAEKGWETVPKTKITVNGFAGYKWGMSFDEALNTKGCETLQSKNLAGELSTATFSVNCDKLGFLPGNPFGTLEFREKRLISVSFVIPLNQRQAEEFASTIVSSHTGRVSKAKAIEMVSSAIKSGETKFSQIHSGLVKEFGEPSITRIFIGEKQVDLSALDASNSQGFGFESWNVDQHYAPVLVNYRITEGGGRTAVVSLSSAEFNDSTHADDENGFGVVNGYKSFRFGMSVDDIKTRAGCSLVKVPEGDDNMEMYGCMDQPFGETKVETAFYFIDGKLGRIAFILPLSFVDEVSKSLKKKYGTPSSHTNWEEMDKVPSNPGSSASIGYAHDSVTVRVSNDNGKVLMGLVYQDPSLDFKVKQQNSQKLKGAF